MSNPKGNPNVEIFFSSASSRRYYSTTISLSASHVVTKHKTNHSLNSKTFPASNGFSVSLEIFIYSLAQFRWKRELRRRAYKSRTLIFLLLLSAVHLLMLRFTPFRMKVFFGVRLRIMISSKRAHRNRNVMSNFSRSLVISRN